MEGSRAFDSQLQLLLTVSARYSRPYRSRDGDHTAEITQRPSSREMRTVSGESTPHCVSADETRDKMGRHLE